jgi:DNA modification methylase
MNTIINDNNTSTLKKMDKETIDLTVTSPPYDDIRYYHIKDASSKDADVFSEQDFQELAKELYRVTKKGGIVVWVVGDSVNKGTESGTSFKQALYFKEVGFLLHDTMIYEKNTSSFPARRSGNRYTQIFEYMFVLSKGKPKTGNLIADKENKWAGFTNFGKNTHRGKDGKLKQSADIKPVPKFSPRNNIWRYVVGKNYNSSDKESHEHPAIFPEKLAEDHILSWSNEGDTVLDPFAGSGTTCKMAKKNKRIYIGIDISKEYCELAEKIIAKY